MKLNKNYILLGNDLIEFVDKNERKSIPISYFEEKGFLVNEGFIPRLDYLKVVDSILGGSNNYVKEKSID